MPALHELYIHDVRLKQLHLQNFRGFGNVTLDFSPENPVTVLIADNGGGKSTLLDAMAEFMRRFFQLAIVGKCKNEVYDEKESYKKTLLGEKDILNERNNASAFAVFNLSYPYPDKVVFEWMDNCAQHLDEHLIVGEAATLGREGKIWTLQLKQKKEFITCYLPDEFQNIPKDLEMLFKQLSDFKVAIYNDQKWHPTPLSIPLLRETKLEFELTRGRSDSMKYVSLPANPKTYLDFTTALNGSKGFISDYAYSTSGYNRYNPLDESYEVLPLLAYYGGSAINTRYDGELKLPYKAGEFQAYKDAFEPQRFNFEEFFAWALWANEKQHHAWKRVKDTILEVMNADHPWYEDISIEAQTLVFYKKPDQESEPVPVEVFQLSDGEKNIMALVGDLAKRAVQLNAVLFKVDVDSDSVILSNPLRYTPGIVLIDEIDLHLHPKWQAKAIAILQKLLPNVQFFITSHSPTVVANFENGSLYIINEGNVIKHSSDYFGREINAVLRNVLGANDRHVPTQQKIDRLLNLIDSEPNNQGIQELLTELIAQVGEDDPDVQKAISLWELSKFND